MNPPFPIRSLTPSDLPAYKAFRDTSLKAFPDAFTSDYETERSRSAESFLSRVSAPGEHANQLWGAFDTNGALIGAVSLEVQPRLQQSHVGILTGMMVDSKFQRQGIAAQLIASCAYFARPSGRFDQIILTVTASNEHAVRLYERAGFVRYGLLPRAICVAGTFYDKLLMRLDLSALHDNHCL